MRVFLVFVEAFVADKRIVVTEFDGPWQFCKSGKEEATRVKVMTRYTEV